MESMTKEFINKFKNDILTGKDAKVTIEANVRTTAGKKVQIPIRKRETIEEAISSTKRVEKNINTNDEVELLNQCKYAIWNSSKEKRPLCY